MRNTCRIAVTCFLFGFGLPTPAAFGQILLDGDFDALTVGTNPDNTVPAGAWGFPANYLEPGVNFVGETDPNQCTVVATSSFDPAGSGNSFHLNASDPAGAVNIHVANLFTQVINETPGEIVTVTFDIWVPTAGIAGGSIYIGGDHGGGGFSLFFDRGPQVSWTDLGDIVAWPAGILQTLVPVYPVAEWQSVQIDIDLVADTFDFSWGTGGTVSPVAQGVAFRSPPLAFLDRFTVVFFSGSWATQEFYVDNVTVTVGSGCVGDLDGDGDTDLADLGILLADFGCMPPPNCVGDLDNDGDTDLADLGILLADFGCTP